MKILIASVCVFALIMTNAVFSVVSAQEVDEPQIKEDAKAFMRAKLEHTKDIVEGLALENFDAIGAHADKLILLSLETNWRTFQTEEYLDLSEEFRDSADRLRTAAKEKNLDGSTLAYFEVTLNCVRCHKYVRKTQHEIKQKKEASKKK